MSRWEQALDAQLDVWRFWNSDLGEKYARGFAKDWESKGRDPGIVDVFARSAEIERSKLLFAEPIWVDGDFVDLIEAAAETFEPEPILPTDLMIESGFAYLPRAVGMIDRHGKRVNFRAILWSPLWRTPDGDSVLARIPPSLDQEEARRAMAEKGWRQTGVTISLYAHSDDADDYADAGELVIGGHKLLLAHMTPIPFGEDFNEVEQQMEAAGASSSVAVPGEAGDRDPDGAGILNYQSARQQWAFVQVLWRLMAQRVSSVKKERPSRAARRRAEREGFEPKVTVIRLRRPKSEPSGETRDVDWSHRWIVGGHWRNQWYPSIEAHRQIWIGPYVKGPPDKELMVRPKRAFELVQ